VIVPNAGRFPVTHSQSAVSYSRHLGAISLFDFDTSDEKYIFEHEFKWQTVLTERLPAGVLICISREALEPPKLLLPAEISRGDRRLDVLPDEIRRMRMCIPAVEALYLGPISTSKFNSFILTAFDDGGGYRLREVTFDFDALHVLTTTATEWQVQH